MEEVSVIVPAYNGSQFGLIDTLQSISDQDSDSLDLIIVDDHSSLKSFQEMIDWLKNSNLRHRAIRLSTNSGLSKAWNSGIQNCSGKYVLLLQQDCRLVGSNAIVKALQELHSYNEVVVLIGTPQYNYGSMNLWQKLAEIRLSRIETNHISNHRREVRFTANKCDLLSIETLNDIGEFDESLRTIGQDWIFSARAASLGIKLVTSTSLQYENNLLGENTFNKLLRKEFSYAMETFPIMRAIKSQDGTAKGRRETNSSNKRTRSISILFFGAILTAALVALFSHSILSLLLPLVIVSLWFSYNYNRMTRAEHYNRGLKISKVKGAFSSVILDFVYSLGVLSGIVKTKIIGNNNDTSKTLH